MTIDDAYAIQAAGIEMRLEAGESIIGGRLGFTSVAMQRAMGVDHPNDGWLTDAMIVHDEVVALDQLIHPKVEPEIAILLADDLTPPVSAAEVAAATAAIIPCLEVVDSRCERFQVTAVDNIADNSSAGMVVFGDPHPLDGIDLRLLGVVVTVDGELHATAAGSAALEHPFAAVAWMANHTDHQLKRGHIVVSGGLTAPVDLVHGTHITAEFDRIGSVNAHAQRKR